MPQRKAKTVIESTCTVVYQFTRAEVAEALAEKADSPLPNGLNGRYTMVLDDDLGTAELIYTFTSREEK